MEGFKQRSDVIHLTELKEHSACCVENEAGEEEAGRPIRRQMLAGRKT